MWDLEKNNLNNFYGIGELKMGVHKRTNAKQEEGMHINHPFGSQN